jgi:hypothetical protein
MVQGADSSPSLVVDVYVSNEEQLRFVVVDAERVDRSFVIALDGDITLTESPLNIYHADITLVSNNKLTDSFDDFFSIYGVNGASSIVVNSGGILRLTSIIVTHDLGTVGSGITVNSGGTLIMSGGVISGNTAARWGGGVFAGGVFTMEVV